MRLWPFGSAVRGLGQGRSFRPPPWGPVLPALFVGETVRPRIRVLGAVSGVDRTCVGLFLGLGHTALFCVSVFGTEP